MTEKHQPEQKSAPQQDGRTGQSRGEIFYSQVVDLGRRARRGAKRLLEKGQSAAVRAGVWAKSAAWTGWEKAADLAAEGWDKAGEQFGKLRFVMARHPVSPLLYITVLAVTIGTVAFQGVYTQAYTVNVDGVEVGVVETAEELNVILDNVEGRVATILGQDYDYDGDITLTPVYTTAKEVTDAAQVEDALFEGVGALITAAAISVDGEELGYASSQDEIYRLLDEIAQEYLTEDAIRYEFEENIEVYPVELGSNTQFDLEELKAILTASEVEEAYYTVKKGDTFNGIAYALGMYPYELSVLNPDVIVDRLMVGEQLLIQQSVPRLSVVTVTEESYEETITSPVEYIETADLYLGSTSLKEKGSDGSRQVNAKVTYLNGVEVEREVLFTQVLKEAVPTYMYTGTTPRPVTASNGYYIWPVRGTLTSYFGYRWGSYHLGIDIGVRHGTTISAADGGRVTYAGWQGSYGNLVVITHDNGAQTYYAHNSALLVSVGDRVYQGQAIAKAGSTGNSTGPHCHFEIRINGTSVNPLNYL